MNDLDVCLHHINTLSSGSPIVAQPINVNRLQKSLVSSSALPFIFHGYCENSGELGTDVSEIYRGWNEADSWVIDPFGPSHELIIKKYEILRQLFTDLRACFDNKLFTTLVNIRIIFLSVMDDQLKDYSDLVTFFCLNIDVIDDSWKYFIGKLCVLLKKGIEMDHLKNIPY